MNPIFIACLRCAVLTCIACASLGRVSGSVSEYDVCCISEASKQEHTVKMPICMATAYTFCFGLVVLFFLLAIRGARFALRLALRLFHNAFRN